MKEAERVANEIIEKYEDITHVFCCEASYNEEMIIKSQRKQCALIHVEGIIENLQLLNIDPHFRTLFSFWQEVKTIIENK